MTGTHWRLTDRSQLRKSSSSGVDALRASDHRGEPDVPRDGGGSGALLHGGAMKKVEIHWADLSLKLG